MKAFSFTEVIVFFAFQLVLGLIAASGVYLVQYGIGWHHYLGAIVTVLFGGYSIFLYTAFVYDIIRAEMRTRA